MIFMAGGFYSGLETTYYTFQEAAIPIEFDGYKIAFVSDFHCKEFGNKEEELINSIYEINPDLVVFTGDMIDGNHEDLTPVVDLLSGLSGKYPMYAISGNHESDSDLQFNELLGYYEEYGVIFLDNAQEIITKGNAQIGIYGKPYVGNYYTLEYLKEPNKSLAEFNILLCHDATVFPVMSTIGYNLILSGHTHGGIIRIPFIGGLINNNGGLFAEYDSGLYTKRNSTLISSRGLGDARIPRFYNRSELICVTLRAK